MKDEHSGNCAANTFEPSSSDSTVCGCYLKIIQIHYYPIRLFHEQENLTKKKYTNKTGSLLDQEAKASEFNNPKQEKHFVLLLDPKIDNK